MSMNCSSIIYLITFHAAVATSTRFRFKYSYMNGHKCVGMIGQITMVSQTGMLTQLDTIRTLQFRMCVLDLCCVCSQFVLLVRGGRL